MSNLGPALRYLWLTLKHKLFVFQAGLRTGAPIWRLVVHDWTKFLPAELPHYGRQFFGSKDDPEGFARAWLHHQNHNPHHWEYWIERSGHSRATEGKREGLVPMPMPEWAVREMVADWMGASRAYEGTWPTSIEAWPWFIQNWRDMCLDRLHEETRERVSLIMRELFPEARIPSSFGDAYDRGILECLQDTCENVPLQSVGVGRENYDYKRKDWRVPEYIPDDEAEEFLWGYHAQALFEGKRV